MKRLFSVLVCIALALALTACTLVTPPDNQGGENTDEDNAYKTVYAQYLTYTEETGDTPLTYEDWLISIRGEDGKDGLDGQDGTTPHIGENGNWWIGDVDTLVPARGNDGADGKDGVNGADGKDGQDGIGIVDIKKVSSNGLTDTYEITYSNGTKTTFTVTNGADGTNGKDGVTPTIEISADGYWVINGVKTEYKAIGTDGKDGVDGEDGKDGVNGTNGKDGVTPTIEISADGYWVINGVKTEYKAIGTDGKDGVDGEDGKDGVDGTNGKDGVTPTIEISADGYWVINGVKTEYKAIGTDGKDGVDGEDGKDGVDGTNGKDGVTPTIEISADGYWVINGVKTKYKAIGTDGKDGVGIASTTMDANGNIVITYTDGTVEVIEHNWTYAYTLKTPTCSETGIDLYNCMDCSLVRMVATDMLPHNELEAVVENRVEPTCIAEGSYDNVVYCSACNKELYRETFVLAKVDHEYVNGVCVVCGQSYGSEGLEYTINADNLSYSVTGIGNCTDSDIVIPIMYNGLPVTKIGTRAFSKCDNITNVTIIGDLSAIEGDAFDTCKNLTNVVILGSVASIGSWSFNQCINLTDFVLTDGIESIGASAFRGCRSLEKINIPASLINIHPSALSGCTSLAGISVDDNNEYYTDIDENLYTKDAKKLVVYALGKLDTAFSVPEGVEIIGEYAFYECTTLKNVTFPDSITTIEKSAFYNCYNLEHLSFPNNLTTIGDYAFYYCYSITSIVLPKNVKNINYLAFSNCNKISKVYYTGNSNDWADISFGLENNYLINATRYYYSENAPTEVGNFWHYVDGEIVIWPEYVAPAYSKGLAYVLSDDGTYYSVSGIGTCTDTDIIIPGTYNGLPVKAIEGSAFAKTNITSITIPDSVTSIGLSAFEYCSKLTSVTISDSVTSIGHQAFMYCSKLTSVTIPDSVTSIGNYSFSNCSNLTSVTIGNGVTSIGSCAFYSCSSLTSITVPDSVTSIGDSAFSYCSKLASVTIPKGVLVGNSVFSNCHSSLYTEYEYGKYVGNAENPYTVLISLTNYILPTYIIHEDCTNIAYGVFTYCDKLTSITIPDSVISIGKYAFRNCSSLTNVNIGNGVTSIGSEAFYNCSNITNVTIGNGVTSIGNYAFYNCSSLKTVYYTGTVEEWANIIFIGEYNFNYHLINATRYYYSESAPTEVGNFWHYVDGEVVVWPEYDESTYYALLDVKNNSVPILEERYHRIYNYSLDADALITEHSSNCSSSACGLETNRINSAFDDMCLQVTQLKDEIDAYKDRIRELENSGSIDAEEINELLADIEETLSIANELESQFGALITAIQYLPCNS